MAGRSLQCVQDALDGDRENGMVLIAYTAIGTAFLFGAALHMFWGAKWMAQRPGWGLRGKAMQWLMIFVHQGTAAAYGALAWYCLLGFIAQDGFAAAQGLPHWGKCSLVIAALTLGLIATRLHGRDTRTRKPLPDWTRKSVPRRYRRF